MTVTFVAMYGGQPTHTALTLAVVQRDALRAERQLTDYGFAYDYEWVPQSPTVAEPGDWHLMRRPKGSLVPAERTGRTIVAMAMTPDEKTTPVDGPFPVRVRATPAGAQLDVSAFLFQAVFTELITKADDSPEDLVEELADMAVLLRAAARGGRDSHARHAFDERMQQFLKEYAAEGTVPVYGAAVGRLAERLGQIAAGLLAGAA